MHDNDPETLEREKNRNLSGSQHKTSTPHEHAPGWNEALASASEASVKADKSTGTAQELQSRTVEYMKTRHAESEGDGTSSTTAFYKKDEVSGPLGDAEGKEEVIVKRGCVVRDDVTADAISEEMREEEEEHMTQSEQDVRADRTEFKTR
ncbi:hypothetical protein B0H34DRAFT_732107 [Crassisporium funariophilum]|nr:hypothetical protein B0H34DRAFT_732107 [Crassisporium funariophilum]